MLSENIPGRAKAFSGVGLRSSRLATALLLSQKRGCSVSRGAETRGGWGRYIPPIIWLYPPNNLNGCTVHLSENWGKKCSISDEDLFFFGLHLNLGKKCSIFDGDLFSSPEFGEKSVPFAFFCSSLNFQT